MLFYGQFISWRMFCGKKLVRASNLIISLIALLLQSHVFFLHSCLSFMEMWNYCPNDIFSQRATINIRWCIFIFGFYTHKIKSIQHTTRHKLFSFGGIARVLFITYGNDVRETMFGRVVEPRRHKTQLLSCQELSSKQDFFSLLPKQLILLKYLIFRFRAAFY